MDWYLWAVLVIQAIVSAQCRLHQYPKIHLGARDGGDPGKPLFLTPYIESGNISEAKRLALVPFTENLRIISYAGFFTVNKTYDSNQFFWYFPAMVPKNKTAPVVVWLQGGPGATSLYGLFTENGPIRVRNGKFERRKYNWALGHHLIYIDNPVGTGFSFTNNSRGYCSDETQVGEDLYSTMTQFFQLFPELQENKFFVTGESYGGKYVPALAYTIHKKNPSAKVKINLKGVAIGNGLSDPEHQMLYSKYLYQIGLLDWNQAGIFEKYENKTRDYIGQGEWEKAFDTFDTLLNGDLIDGKSIFYNMTGFNFYFNFLHTKDYNTFEDFGPMIQKTFVRKAIHVGDLPFHNGTEVETHLKQDIMKSVAPWIAELLDHYYVVVYNGQLDIIVAYPLTVNYLRNLKFAGSEDYKTAKRYIWKVDGEVAGYVKQAGKLVEIMVRNAGHMVPGDQPKWALDLITRFTHEKTFEDHKKQ
ncbi:venom serine carboxypeptidase isoform X2 [Pectinophora gossypiella]|uniref:venom serine carboxypeptidase isoform X2 n=1 Tax=Pectinophora gossypiella TaxID=13191 RepID=UPI00214F2E5E|nr:venom serine carboxypeptidase isoform X2 [Pectinophora gossypiella]